MAFLVAMAVLMSLSSCELVGDIFKAGMGFGIFLVVAVVALIIFAFSRLFGKR